MDDSEKSYVWGSGSGRFVNEVQELVQDPRQHIFCASLTREHAEQLCVAFNAKNFAFAGIRIGSWRNSFLEPGDAYMFEYQTNWSVVPIEIEQGHEDYVLSNAGPVVFKTHYEPLFLLNFAASSSPWIGVTRVQAADPNCFHEWQQRCAFEVLYDEGVCQGGHVSGVDEPMHMHVQAS